MLTFEEALEQLLASARKLKGEDRVPLGAAAGRILAQPLASSINVPPLDNSAMDGYAVRVSDVQASGTVLPVAQRIPAGSIGHTLAPGTAARIFTGASVPAGADAVVMQERCGHAGEGRVSIDHVPKPGEHIRRAGEDIRAGDEILPAGALLTPQAIGLAASVGASRLSVMRPFRVGLLTTGDELAEPGEPLPPGGIYNSNRFLLVAMLQRLGCEVEDFGHVPDTLEATKKALAKAAALSDLVLTTGGVSVGEEDHVKPAVEAVGELNLWKIGIKPGKPLAFGKVGQADFVGLPGNPVSAFVTFLMLVRPFIRKCQGASEILPRALAMTAAFDWPKPDKRREFLRARIAADGRVELFPHQGSGVLTSTVRSDGLVDNPPGQAVRPGDSVRFLPFSELL
ncbi:MAG: molybdopterin molybdotransferase MoeA [Candidatus Nitricoxidivorans perseverans]|uniref:Molybdopterin molybdenumtransferase n=1 Tax=Candidatus Nitricoxidivorans perseverans TaxID=2975601 RepID=A0AA49FMJ4_9PROT|nr:MAG: molybdopterin molybdotransferase MoeA [Candidatus Nitricoxidivorans perseverans]